MVIINGRNPLKTFRVASRSEIDDFTGLPYQHLVELWADGNWCCDCGAFQWNKKGKICWHCQQQKELLTKQYGSVQKAIEFFRKEKNEQRQGE